MHLNFVTILYGFNSKGGKKTIFCYHRVLNFVQNITRRKICMNSGLYLLIFFQIRAHFDEEKEDDEENDIDSA